MAAANAAVPRLLSLSRLNPWSAASASAAPERLLLGAAGFEETTGAPRALTWDSLRDTQQQLAAVAAATGNGGAARGGRGGAGVRGGRGGGRGGRGGAGERELPPPSVSLLRKLFADDVTKEYSKVLQCLRYISDNGFFLNDPLPAPVYDADDSEQLQW